MLIMSSNLVSNVKHDLKGESIKGTRGEWENKRVCAWTEGNKDPLADAGERLGKNVRRGQGGPL